MHTTPNAELDRRINAAISRQLAPPPASLTLTDAALLAHCAIDAANNANVPIVLARWMPMACSVTSLVRITPCSSAIRWPRKGMDRRGAQDADHRLAADVLPGASLYGLSHTQGLCCFGGGLPCWSAGVLLGGIGISGGSVEEDIAIATQTRRTSAASIFAHTIP